MEMQSLYLLVPLAPLVGAAIAGLLCRVIPRWVAHTAAISGVAIAFVASFVIFKDVMAGNTFNGPVYTWLTSGDYRFEVGFLIDQLTVTMMLVVTFVSLMVSTPSATCRTIRATTVFSATSHCLPSRC